MRKIKGNKNSKSSFSGTNINTKSNEQIPIHVLNKLTYYYLVDDHTLSLPTEFMQQIFLLLVSASGGPVYALPATDNAHGNQILIPQYVIGVCIPAAIVLYNASDIFFKMLRHQRIPTQLQDILVSPKNRFQQIREYITIGVVSTFSAIPLTTTALTYPLFNNLFFIIVSGIVIQFDNTTLHFLPVKLILEDPFYRAPFIPFETLYQWIRNCYLSEDELLIRAFEEHKQKNQTRLKNLLIKRLHYIQQKIIQEDFSWDWWRGRYISHIPQDILMIIDRDAENVVAYEENEENGENDKILLKLSNYKKSILPKTHSEDSWFCSWLRPLNGFIRNALYAVGAAWVTGSYIGYLANPINQLDDYTHSYYLATGLTAPAIYSFGVLLCFFGGNMLRDLYDYFTLWGETDTKIPLEVKLYPKTFLLLMVFNIYLAIFSPEAAVELVEDNFSDDFWNPVRPYFVALAASGIRFLAFFAMRDFYLIILRKIALHFGGIDTKMAAKLIEKCDQLINAIGLLNGNLLEENLKTWNKEQLEAVLGISETEFKQLIDHEGTFKAKIPRRYFPFLSRTVKEEEKQLIAETNTLTI